MPSSSLSDQILKLLSRGVVSANQLQAAMEASPATVRRALDELGPTRILRMGNGRATRYGARRTPNHCGATSWPLHEVNQLGVAQNFATLHALASDQWYVEPAPGYSTHPTQVGSDRGVFDGLPWFTETARPQGFLGRIFALKAHRLAQFPLSLEDWTDDHVLASALMLGDDLPGNLLVGPAALRFEQAKLQPPASHSSDSDVEMEMAMRAVINGDSTGSSAGGEQPKFTRTVQTETGEKSQLIVKFSPEMVTPGARRWGDLLVAEHVANEVLREAGIPAAATRIRNINNRIYLESKRFDRHGEQGRQGISALGPLAYSLGYGSNKWDEAAQVLAEANIFTPAQVAQVKFVQDFGKGVGNTDMHLGNMSLLGSVSQGWDVAPVYDMTPMAYAPGRTMEISPNRRELPLSTLSPEVLSVVHRFWDTLAQNSDLSDNFKAVAAHHAQEVATARLSTSIAQPVADYESPPRRARPSR